MIKFLLYCYFFVVFTAAFVKSDKECVSDDVRKSYCEDNELCVYGHCQCMPGYTKLNNECIKNSTEPSPRVQPEKPKIQETDTHNHLAIAVVPVLLIIIFIGSVIMVRKYNVVSWIRNKISQRDTPYDEVMIGQDDDDPPLSGV